MQALNFASRTYLEMNNHTLQRWVIVVKWKPNLLSQGVKFNLGILFAQYRTRLLYFKKHAFKKHKAQNAKKLSNM